MELFPRGGCLGRAGVFWGLCKRDCFCQSFWIVAVSGCFVGAGRLVCVGMQEVQGIVLIDKRIIGFSAFFVLTWVTEQF